jgi:uncharacterized protein with beta-barrel porin domain
MDTNLATQTVNVAAGATVSYQGTDSLGRSIVSARSDTNASTEIINNNGGTISSGSGLFAIYMANSVGATAANSVQINSSGSIIGGIFCNGANSTQLNLNGLPAIAGSSLVQGGITLTPKVGGTSTLNVGNTTAGTIYTTGGTIQFASLIHIQNNSTMSIQFAASDIVAITVAAGSTLNVNNTIGGLATGSVYGADGAINNSGTMNVASNITKSGAFNTLAGGVTNVSETVSISTTNFNANLGTFGAVMNNVNSYCNLTLPSATTVHMPTVDLSYTGGYLPGQTYTLVTASNGFTTAPSTFSIPSNTLFLTFNTPVVNGNTLLETIQRTPFQTYAQSSMTQQVGQALEAVGSSGNVTSSMLTILNAVEASTTSQQTENALRQLAPLIAAPTYGLEVQAAMMDVVELRLAQLNQQKTYFAGDLATQNAVWIRPFGDQANQGQLGDSLGFYASTGGIALGFDRYVDNGFILGVAGSYALSHVQDKLNGASITKIKSYQALLYGSMDLNATKYVDWMLAAAANSYDGTRNINFNGLSLQAQGSYSSQIYGVKGIWGKNFSAFNFLQVTPEFSGQYTFAKQYAYSETGAEGANLQVNRDNSNVVQIGGGLKLATPLDWHPGICVPEIHGNYYYNVVNGQQQTFATFLAGGGLILANIPLQRSWLKVGVALTFALLDQIEVVLNYDHWIADRFTDNAVFLNLKFYL